MTIYIFKLLLSMLLGIFIGIERQSHDKLSREKANRQSVGLRTFAIITTLGTIAGFFSTSMFPFFLVLSAGVMLLIISYYVLDSWKSKDIGVTTELTLIWSYMIGVLLAVDLLPIQLIIGMTVVLVFLLSQKERLQTYVQAIRSDELQGFIRYLIVALVILPLLPNTTYHMHDLGGITSLLESVHLSVAKLQNIELVNPFQLWLLVALVTGVDVIGYILERVIGKKKGWFLTSFAAGFVSSTATVQSLAQQSKTAPNPSLFVVAAIVANMASFVQHAVLVFPVNSGFFIHLLPVIALMLTSGALMLVVFNRSDKDQIHITEHVSSRRQMFYLFPAIRFALLFVIIKIAGSIALALWSTNAFLFTVALGAIPGLDAVVISISQNVFHGVSLHLALSAFLIANAVNMLVKNILAFVYGKRVFAVRFLLSSCIMLLTGVLGLFIA